MVDVYQGPPRYHAPKRRRSPWLAIGLLGAGVTAVGVAIYVGTKPPGDGGTKCDTGYHWDATQKKCVQDAVDTKCPTGYHWDSALNKCILDSACPTGQHWDASKGACVADVANCNPGYHWDDTLKKCIIDPGTAPPGKFNLTVLATADGQLVAGATLTIVDASNGNTVATATAGPGGTIFSLPTGLYIIYSYASGGYYQGQKYCWKGKVTVNLIGDDVVTVNSSEVPC